MLELSPTVDNLLTTYRAQLGGDYDAYRGHVQRVLAFCELLDPTRFAENRSAFDVSAIFHDLGLWTETTMDYLPPSRALAKTWLDAGGQSANSTTIEAMIEHHHRMRPLPDPSDALAEIFRKADLIDVSMGLIRFGAPAARVREINAAVPSHGFHQRLVALWLGWMRKQPLNPFPMMRF